MPQELPKVAFLGLGKMGVAMAANIQRAGFPLTVWNRSTEKAEPLVAKGAVCALTPMAAVANADIVISSLADDDVVSAIVTGPTGILAGLRKGAIHVGTSTISPRLADRLAQDHIAHGSFYVAGPVVGRTNAAEAAQLMTILAGDAGAIETARPVIAAYASGILPGGQTASQANTAKLIANFLGASGMDLIGQTLALGERSGVAPELLRMMLFGFFGNEATREYVDKIAARNFDDVGFTATGGLKDVELMIAAGRDVDLELSSAQALQAKLSAAVSRGWDSKDWSCLTDIDRLRQEA